MGMIKITPIPLGVHTSKVLPRAVSMAAKSTEFRNHVSNGLLGLGMSWFSCEGQLPDPRRVLCGIALIILCYVHTPLLLFQ